MMYFCGIISFLVELVDAEKYLHDCVTAAVLVGEGECPLMNDVDVLYRVSMGCACKVGARFINGHMDAMIGGQFSCLKCPEENANICPSKFKGLVTPSVVKGYAEHGLVSENQAARYTLKLLKVYGLAKIREVDEAFLSGSKKCPAVNCEVITLECLH